MSILKFKSILPKLSSGILRNTLLPTKIVPLKILCKYSSGSNLQTQENEHYDRPKLLNVHLPNTSEPLKLHPIWLRDHCRCPECYNDVTCQRNNDILKLSDQIAISTYSQSDDLLHICWSDGHKSSYSIPWLVSNTYDGKYKALQEETDRLTTWDGTTVNLLGLEPISHQRLMSDDKILREIYRRVIQYGFVKIEQVPPTKLDTSAVIERICRMSHTVFGKFWETGTNFDHKDTGYLNGYLEAHTDNTYFTEAQGLLVFHCTHFDGTGCESFLVDGFHVAKQLKQLDPSAYGYLSKVNMESEYIEPGEHFSSWGPIFRHHPVSHKLEQIRFNMLDRSPLSSIPQEEVGTHYRYLKTMATLVKKKENEYRFRLSPGTVMIIDNWRLLHGRESYQGERVLRGCYYSRSDFMSKARHYGIIS
ncbi:hypothetical protein DAPPUDRAFT_306710 [Daphnia pulex]|uniref:Trimethyllysine dioxygenase, mitochondrial n=1 Tax=Daphnia pulex TaxID=6669 RepID=E9GXY5_DAPPU|nr:hypothetical protein DAPPUDRAFT_306710 [Daphnia pulex]|eukprot:EFX75501.1 hypothetical protein DAPPUDRAFT_306710 [Daphnia pulex]